MQYGDRSVLQSVTLNLHASSFVAIGGPNGAGKSTLLNVLAGLARPATGVCYYLNREVAHWPRRAFAQRVAVVSQAEPSAFPFTVGDVVFMGRMPHNSNLCESGLDRDAVAKALRETGTENFRDRDFRTLSGGEKQRVLLASALAQDPQVLLLDEPATHLDLQHQVELHELLHRLSRHGLLIVAVTHDLNLASTYADRLLLIHEGRLEADGPPEQVLRASLLRRIFQVDVEIQPSSDGRPWLRYGPLHA